MLSLYSLYILNITCMCVKMIITLTTRHTAACKINHIYSNNEWITVFYLVIQTQIQNKSLSPPLFQHWHAHWTILLTHPVFPAEIEKCSSAERLLLLKFFREGGECFKRHVSLSTEWYQQNVHLDRDGLVTWSTTHFILPCSWKLELAGGANSQADFGWLAPTAGSEGQKQRSFKWPSVPLHFITDGHYK